MRRKAYLNPVNITKSWNINLIPIILLLLATFAVTAYADTFRASISSTSVQGNNNSYESSISADGQFVAFESFASDLVDGDTNGVWDIFVRDTVNGNTERVSVSSAGGQSNGDSYYLRISSDGRYVAFRSDASNLVADDTNGSSDVFVHDRLTRETERVSVSSGGVQGNNDSGLPFLSSDGRFVAFESDADNLVTGDTNDRSDIFVRDRYTGVTTRVSVSTTGVQGNKNSYYPGISSDGRFVTFESKADNLVNGDTNGVWDIFVHDRDTGETTRVSISSAGAQGNGKSRYPFISSNAQYVAFESIADNLVDSDTNGSWDVFLHDILIGETTQLAVSSVGVTGKDHSHLSVSSDGRYVAFESNADDLVDGDTNGLYDIFVHDRDTGQNTIVSVSATGELGNDRSHGPYISLNGQFVAFESDSTNLVENDTNGSRDIFVVDRFAALSLVTPNGGQTLTSGGTYQIQWDAPVFAETFNLQYSLNNGKDWYRIAKGVTGNTYDWEVPTPKKNKKKCLVRIFGYNASGKRIAVDKSDASFAIQVMKVTSPNGGEVLASGGTFNVNWDTNGTESPIEYVKIFISTDSGNTWELMKTESGNPGSSTCDFPVVKRNKNECLVKVKAYDSADKKVALDKSDSPFTIEVVTITSPNGGETLTSGSTHTIRWDTYETKKEVAKVKLHYTKNNGNTWKKIIKIKGDNPGSYDWTVPTYGKTKTNCKVKVRLYDANGKKLGKDSSDSTFTIEP